MLYFQFRKNQSEDRIINEQKAWNITLETLGHTIILRSIKFSKKMKIWNINTGSVPNVKTQNSKPVKCLVQGDFFQNFSTFKPKSLQPLPVQNVIIQNCIKQTPVLCIMYSTFLGIKFKKYMCFFQYTFLQKLLTPKKCKTNGFGSILIILASY